MEHKMSRRGPGVRFLCVAFLLGFANGAFGSINPGKLTKIVDYITKYGIQTQYAVAVRLDKKDCQDPTEANLQAALPKSVMDQMHEAIEVRNGIHVPEEVGNVVAARPNFQAKDTEHAEWRLLSGGQNSPTAKILENKPRDDSCLIFFSKWSPCTKQCLNEKDEMRNIVQWLNLLFNTLGEDSRAFVFQTVFGKDYKKRHEVVVEAWKRIKDAPLFQCDGNGEECIKCFDNNDQINPKCLVNEEVDNRGVIAATRGGGHQHDGAHVTWEYQRAAVTPPPFGFQRQGGWAGRKAAVSAAKKRPGKR